MPYGLDPVQQFKILSPQEHQDLALEREAKRMTLTALAEKRRAEIAQQQAEQQEKAYLADAYQRLGGDEDEIIKEAMTRNPDLGMRIQDHVTKRRTAIIDSRKKALDVEKLEAELDTELLSRITDDASYQIYRPRLSKELQQVMGEQFDPARREALLAQAPGGLDRLNQLKALIGTNPREALLLDLAGADSPEEWAGVWQGYQALGVKPQEIAALQQIFGKEFSPDALASVRAKVTKPASESSGGFTLSPGQQRFDAQGNPIASVAPRPTGGGGTGGGGISAGDKRLVDSILKNPSIYGTLTPTVKTRIASALSDAGFDFAAGTGGGGAVKLTAGQQEDIATSNDVLGLIDEAETLGTKINWKGVGAMGTGSIAKRAMDLGLGGTAEEEQLRNIIGNINGTIAKARGGTSFTESEKAMLSQYSPTINDGDDRIKAKLVSLRSFLTRRKQNILGAATGQTAQADAEPKRPAGVPTNAVWDKQQKLWVIR